MAIAENVRNQRKIKGLTQEEFAEKCGVSFGSYKRFENKGEISLFSLVKIGKVLGCDDQLLDLFNTVHYESIEEVIRESELDSKRRRR